MCGSTLRSAGRRKTVPARTGWREQRSTTTWPTRTTSQKRICSCIASIGRRGHSKSCCDRGSRGGDWSSGRSAARHSTRNGSRFFVCNRAFSGHSGKKRKVPKRLGGSRRSNRTSELPHCRRGFYLEPDGVQRRQEYQSEDCSGECSTDQAIRQRAPEDGVRERNEGQHGGERCQDHRTGALDRGFDDGIERRQSILLVGADLTD